MGLCDGHSTKGSTASHGPDLTENHELRTSLVVQWLRLCASNAGGTETKNLRATQCDQKNI